MSCAEFGSQRGSSTVAATALAVTALLLAAGILAWSAVTRAAMQAASAADLAALAAADTARGLRVGDPCAAAGLLASTNAARLDSCTVEADGTTVRVQVSVAITFSALGIEFPAASAQARAGAPPLTRD
ncbi:Rv3654c family TadE-like protein [Glutamicibacter protophormiae]|uniref:Rv3654c family TadE-like protein n=1 Tax=Glutamicibacter protophormiae TaxID=37930 RepID=UPI002A7F49CC|nr:Rv3654c family TadE-like protein [Glutamicibacter protophormiae]WPR63799.1 Rv3654c family TadE-like protein [Glutamicibacter protophormiae]WPR67294.1 Rv3654c family TadE-like protein [Glutamicibacter protophormiae]